MSIARTFRLLMKLRGLLPDRVWTILRDLFWRLFWKREEAVQKKERGERSLRLWGSERALLTERIADQFPFSSILEIGCSYGQNFHTLISLFPDVSMRGVDADEKRIEAGREILLQKGISNVELGRAEGDNLSEFSDKSFDLVVSSAFLLYVGPERIEQTIREMIRVSKRALILLEQHEEKPYYEGQDLGSMVYDSETGGGYWIRDYKKLLGRIVPEAQVMLKKIPSPVWTSEQWKVLGFVIEVRLS